MAYVAKAKAMQSIAKRRRVCRNGTIRTDWETYLGQDPFTKRTVRISRSDRQELIREITDFYNRQRAGGDAAARLNAAQALDAMSAYDALAAAGLKVSLLEVANAYIGGGTVSQQALNKPAAEAYEEYLSRMPDGANKTKTVSTVGKFIGKFNGLRLADIAAKDVQKYLEANYGDKAPKTYNSHLEYLNTFLNWCRKDENGYLAKNPIASLAYRPEPWVEPEYMKPEEVEKLFRLLEAKKEERPEWLAYAVTSFFCGCRAVEIVRMATDPAAAKISLEDETVRMAKAKGYQQGKKPRAFHIDATALAWMKSFDFLGALGKVRAETAKEIFAFARENGVGMFHNCGRHSFITYHVAKYGDPAKTTAMAGTSDKMRADNYCGLASKKDGEAYFGIMPGAGA